MLRTFLPPSAVSTLGDMLSLRLDGERQDTFLDVYRASGAKPEEMWSALAERGYDTETIAGLQTDAVLGQMTLQNAGVVARLTQNIGITVPADLADRGFHRAGAWVDVISGDVPEGVSAEEYAAGLAAQVALRFPTRVTADLVRAGTIDVTRARRRATCRARSPTSWPAMTTGSRSAYSRCGPGTGSRG